MGFKKKSIQNLCAVGAVFMCLSIPVIHAQKAPNIIFVMTD